MFDQKADYRICATYTQPATVQYSRGVKLIYNTQHVKFIFVSES